MGSTLGLLVVEGIRVMSDSLKPSRKQSQLRMMPENPSV
jgi:hypothetical protein